MKIKDGEFPVATFIGELIGGGIIAGIILKILRAIAIVVVFIGLHIYFVK